MALPKSTFVMGAVTLGLFGVAIYQTANKTREKQRAQYNLGPDDVDGVDDDDDYARDALQRYAAEHEALAQKRAAEEKLRSATLARQRTLLQQLYGAEKASPGPLFAGIELDGKTTPDGWVERRKAFMEQSGLRVSIGTGDTNDRFEVFPRSLDDDGLCTELQTALDTAWGSPYIADDRAQLWTNTITGVRASLTQSSGCELVIERYDEPAKWLNKSATSTVPYGWLGRPAKQVAEAVGAIQRGEVIEWTAHGVGAGSEQTKIQAFVDAGRISHVVATTSADTPTRAALEEHLRAEFGKAKVDASSGSDLRLEWPSKNLVVVLGASGGIAVMNRKP